MSRSKLKTIMAVFLTFIHVLWIFFTSFRNLFTFICYSEIQWTLFGYLKATPLSTNNIRRFWQFFLEWERRRPEIWKNFSWILRQDNSLAHSHCPSIDFLSKHTNIPEPYHLIYGLLLINIRSSRHWKNFVLNPQM